MAHRHFVMVPNSGYCTELLIPTSGKPEHQNLCSASLAIVGCLVCGHGVSSIIGWYEIWLLVDQNALTDPQGLPSCPDGEKLSRY